MTVKTKKLADDFYMLISRRLLLFIYLILFVIAVASLCPLAALLRTPLIISAFCSM